MLNSLGSSWFALPSHFHLTFLVMDSFDHVFTTLVVIGCFGLLSMLNWIWTLLQDVCKKRQPGDQKVGHPGSHARRGGPDYSWRTERAIHKLEALKGFLHQCWVQIPFVWRLQAHQGQRQVHQRQRLWDVLAKAINSVVEMWMPLIMMRKKKSAER